MSTEIRTVLSLSTGERFVEHGRTFEVAAPVVQTGASVPAKRPGAPVGAEVAVLVVETVEGRSLRFTAEDVVEVLVPEPEGLTVARITLDLALPAGLEITDEVREALDDLVSVMLVQAEDGLYTGGHQDAYDPEDPERLGRHLCDFGTYQGENVQIVEVDDASSASRQCRIDTGIYMLSTETQAL